MHTKKIAALALAGAALLAHTQTPRRTMPATRPC
jgi:hypothetical protein